MPKSRIIKGLRNFFVEVLCLPIRFYQVFISPLLPPCCKYEPSCSHYAVESLKKHGPVKGFYLSVKRILRCNPYSRGGYDPVPEEYVLFKNIKVLRNGKK